MTVDLDISRDELIHSLRAMETVLREKGVTGLAIFGSRARGDHRPDSDLDVLVDIDPGIKFSLLDLANVQLQISDQTGIATQATIKSDMSSPFAKRIVDDLTRIF